MNIREKICYKCIRTDGSCSVSYVPAGSGVLSKLFSFSASGDKNRTTFDEGVEAIRIALEQLLDCLNEFEKVVILSNLQAAMQSIDVLVNFLIGECKLEQFLEDNPPIESNFTKAKSGLAEAKRYLQTCISEQGAKLNVMRDAHLLLAKLLYSQGFYEESLSHLNKGGLDSLHEKQLSNRIMKVVAESFAVKGLCLEKVPPSSTSKFKSAEREEQILQALVKSGDLTLRYLQEMERTQGNTGGTVPQLMGGVNPPSSGSPLPPNTEYRIGPILETALQRAPILYIKNGNLKSAIDQYRKVLSAIETSSTQSLRQTMSRQLAEVLIRGVCEKNYVNFAIKQEGKNPESPWKPKKYMGPNLFTPKDENEEILLLLFISEAMAVRNAVLDLSPEFREARIHSYNNVTAVYDLLTISLCRRSQYSLLVDSFERAMKFAFEEQHVWNQFALSLISSGKYSRAYFVLHEVARLQPTDSLPCLLAARICLENLDLPAKGLKMAEKALEREIAHPQNLLARCLVAVGLGYEMMSTIARTQAKRHELKRKAFESFSRAAATDPNDHLPEFYLALHYAQARQLSEAVLHAKMALHLRAEHIHSLHLLVLLLSAQKQCSEALQLIDAALEEYPDNFNLLCTKAHLEEYCLGAEVGLLTSKQMLQLWKTVYESKMSMDPSCSNMNRASSDNKSVFQIYSSEFSDVDSGSPAGNSGTAAARVEAALSEVASSISGFQPKPGPKYVWLLQLHIWLLIVELYLRLGQLKEAEASIHEANALFPLSHQLMVMKGRIHELRQEYSEAKICFQNAVAVNPFHVKALQHLSMVHHNLGNSRLAEKLLRDAVSIDPMSHQTWYNMGKVLQDMGDFITSSECIATAIELESTCPILPFSNIPRTFE
ncbi:tetratricopeptide repeat protein 7B-like [Uloborus diversus]|uniref:tetratricopeptide repeat protein 7B-like n=1 Tax=Uloborus diversus TaxID=327109 RepID=UPI0024094AA3|nr:tetratricopeptide repeat protein 7B-like [Uloborus diversus]